MDLSWSLLLVMGILTGAVAFWHSTLGARELANAAAHETCQRVGAQLLDGTVAFQRLKPVRGHDGWLEFERTYLFEYTLDGATRRQGFVIVAGRTVETVGLES